MCILSEQLRGTTKVNIKRVLWRASAKRWLPLVLPAFCLIASQKARATAEYARTEAKSCQYCHESGGPGFVDPKTNVKQPSTLNSRGIYYAGHSHTFAGYKEPASTVQKSGNILRFAWREELTDLPRRIAVADIKGDGIPRLITLNDVPDHKDRSILMVKRWIEGAKGFATEISVEIASPPNLLEVGRFAGKDQPTVILTRDDAWYWDGKTLVRKSSSRSLPLLGVSMARDGAERVLVAENGTGAKAFRVNLRAQAGGLLTDGVETPHGKQVLWGDMHGETALLDKMGVPETITGGGMFGLWTTPKIASLVLYYPKNERDFDVSNDPEHNNRPKFLYKGDPFSTVLLTGGSGEDLWSSPRLRGNTLDIAVTDAKTAGSPGILVLTSLSQSGIGRTLYFFGFP